MLEDWQTGRWIFFVMMVSMGEDLWSVFLKFSPVCTYCMCRVRAFVCVYLLYVHRCITPSITYS
jgi:hypothetical protein